jgi:hypothetical protein
MRVSVAAARYDELASAAAAAMAHILRVYVPLSWDQGEEHLLVMPYGMHASARAVRLL